MVNVTSISLEALATSLPYIASLQAFNSSTPLVTFHEYAPEFSQQVLGAGASWRLLRNESYQAFHEAGVYDRATRSLYISSNWAGSAENPINVTVVALPGPEAAGGEGAEYAVSSRRFAGLVSPNGGRTFVAPGAAAAQTQLLFADEGDMSGASALTLLDPVSGNTKQILNNYNGKNFSSINDVVQHPTTGDVWFTDAQYGWLQYFRPEPQLPNQVYRFEPQTGRVRVVADSFTQSNGIEFSPDLQTLYVTDTGAFLGPRGGHDATGPAHIYAFDVLDGGTRLANRRTFAYVEQGAPDGIHTDTRGNVYAACGDGVRVWSAQGRLLGVVRVQGGAANFAFVPGGMMVFNEYRLFLVTMLARGREVERDFGGPG